MQTPWSSSDLGSDIVTVDPVQVLMLYETPALYWHIDLFKLKTDMWSKHSDISSIITLGTYNEIYNTFPTLSLFFLSSCAENYRVSPDEAKSIADLKSKGEEAVQMILGGVSGKDKELLVLSQSMYDSWRDLRPAIANIDPVLKISINDRINVGYVIIQLMFRYDGVEESMYQNLE